MTPPNILVIMADQLAPHFTGAYGHEVVKTPHLDALAERGMRFDAAYFNSPLFANNMICIECCDASWDNAASGLEPSV